MFSLRLCYLFSHVRLNVTPWITARQASLSITNSWSPPKPMSNESVMPSNHLTLCHPLLPSIFPIIRVFSNESVLHIMWPKYWSFSLNISSSNEYSGLISFRMDWLDPLAVQETDCQESFPTPQFKNINSSALSFLYSQLSYPYMTTGKTIALTRQAFVDKVMFLLFNMLSYLVMTFLPRSKCFFNFMAAVTVCSDFGAQENKNLLLFSLFSHLFAMKWWGQMPRSSLFESEF